MCGIINRRAIGIARFFYGRNSFALSSRAVDSLSNTCADGMGYTNYFNTVESFREGSVGSLRKDTNQQNQ